MESEYGQYFQELVRWCSTLGFRPLSGWLLQVVLHCPVQVVRGFLVARQHRDIITALVCGMADSGLPCFKFPNTLQAVSCMCFCHCCTVVVASRLCLLPRCQLWSRFLVGSSDLQAAKFMRARVLDAANKYTTIIYDGIQKLQNDIHSEKFQ